MKVRYLFLMLVTIASVSGCRKNSAYNYNYLISQQLYTVVNVVADTAGMGAAVIDGNLRNAWGMAFSGSGSIWISSNREGVSVVYDRSGQSIQQPVLVHSQASRFGGTPTGLVENTTKDFVIPLSGVPAVFIFAQQDGTLSAWVSGDSTISLTTDAAPGSVYTGITIANDGTANFIYLADFKGRKIDVVDASFHYVSGKAFADPSIPSGFSPFNIKNIGGKLFVLYAKQNPPANIVALNGSGFGFIDIFNPDGTLVKRFASQGVLNSPWGITLAPSGFGQGDNVILVGNNGDGMINVFDQNGNYLNQLRGSGNYAVTISGLWSVSFSQNNNPPGDPNELMFTAGPGGGTHGLYGYIYKK